MAKRSNKGGIGSTALGFLALGFSSAVFGALVVGPRLASALGEKEQTPVAPPGPRVSSRPQPKPAEDVPNVDDLVKNVKRAPEDPAAEEPKAKEEQPESALDKTEAKSAPTKPEAKEEAPAEEPLRRSATPKRNPVAAPAEETEPTPPVVVKRQDPFEEEPATTKPSVPATMKSVTPAARKSVAPVKPSGAALDKSPAAIVPTAPTATAIPAAGADAGTFRVRVGRYQTRAEAERVLGEMEKAGSQGAVFLVGGTYRVQVGVFNSRSAAARISDALKAQNFPAEVYDSPRRAPRSADAVR
jgi:cell division protein FtsN